MLGAAGKRKIHREEITNMSRRLWDRVRSRVRGWPIGVLVLGLAAGLATLAVQHRPVTAAQNQPLDGQAIFRFDTFGDEQLWTDRLRMHEVIESSVDPLTALAVGLKVDVEALPPALVQKLRQNRVPNEPATTVALIKLNAVVGVVGTVQRIGGRDRLTRVGITCALCHSTVDDSLLPGIGRRLDGWPNLDLDPGRIIALSPAIPAESL
jgi:hypothetical protein